MPSAGSVRVPSKSKKRWDGGMGCPPLYMAPVYKDNGPPRRTRDGPRASIS